MRPIMFNPYVHILEPRTATVDKEVIRREPMIAGGSWSFCRAKGGVLTHKVMDTISDDVLSDIKDHALRGYHPVIDTKVVMLMPGMVPCIPGWHCDGVIRKDDKSQPNLDTLKDPTYHYIASVSTDEELCPTEICNSPVFIEVDEGKVWESVNRGVIKEDPMVLKLRSGMVTRFSRQTLHRGTAATKRGWRFFFRLSFYHMPVQNEIRNQVQVYTQDQGW